MLYKYNFIKKHKMHKLNQHFLFFIRKTRTVNTNTTFIPNKYFHSSFLNIKGKIAPNGRENKNLTESFKLFFDTYKKLDQCKKDEFYNLIVLSNSIHLYFEDETKDVCVLKKDNIVRIIGDQTFENLMMALWNSLKTNSWEIDEHYSTFFQNLETKTCPFCGINHLPNPNSYRADYDHLAFKGDYPISAINLKNIAPACEECNQKRKHKKDVFYKTDNGSTTRRPYNYPYSHSYNIEIDFKDTILPNTDSDNMNGAWNIDLKPKTKIVETWEEVYEIKQRYVDEVLKIEYNKWMFYFIDEHKGSNVKTEEELKKRFIKNFKRYYRAKLEKQNIVHSSLLKYFYKCNNKSLYQQLIKQLN